MASNDRSGDDAPQRQLRQACAAMDRAWRTGSSAKAEEWLDACPAIAADDDLAVELIYSEFVARETTGAPPPPVEYYTRFPRWSERLRRLFEVDDLLKSDVKAGSTANGRADTQAEAGALPTPTSRKIGAYELLERIGGGGMGVVFRARQNRPGRIVALKLLRAGVDAAATELARFRREAEAAARLQHPNIVSVFEVGEHEQQPYLAMEYVAGGDLRQHLAGRPIDTQVAVGLVVKMARAVQHAHENGVVHRDLKPSNVLLQKDEGGRRKDESPASDLSSSFILHPSSLHPKIADFGLAALLDEQGGLTRSGQVVGTTAYMCPEQAAGSRQGAAPAADVYSLGAILYECLTGRPPFAADSEAETLRQVMQDDPMSPRRLRPQLPRDLETIVLKCLAKVPGRRYASALALAEDLEHFAAQRPIQARPSSRFERTWKWTKRHPAAAGLIAVCVAGLIGGVVLTAVYTRQLQAAVADAKWQKDRANDALESEAKRRVQARTALDELTGRLIADAQVSPKKTADQLEQLERALKSYEELAADDNADEASRMGVAEAIWQSARLHATLGRSKDFHAAISRAAAIYRKLADEFPTNPTYLNRYAGAMQDRATVSLAIPRAEALNDLRAALAIFRTAAAQGGPFEQAQLARALGALATRLDDKDKECDQTATEALQIWERLHENDPANLAYRYGLATGLHNRAVHTAVRGTSSAAEADYRRSLALRRTDDQQPKDIQALIDQSRGLENLARLLAARSAYEDAAHEFRQAIEVLEILAEKKPNVPYYARQLHINLSVLSTYSRQCNRPETDGSFTRTRKLFERRLAVEYLPEVAIDLAGCTCNHGNYLRVCERFPEALAAYEAATRVLIPLLEHPAIGPTAKLFKSNVHLGEAKTYASLGRHTDAVKAWESSIALVAEPNKPAYRIEMAVSLARMGELTRAEAVLNDTTQLTEVGTFANRATVHAILASRSRDEATIAAHEKKAIGYLLKLHDANKVTASLFEQLRHSPDWAALRDRPTLSRMLTAPVD